MKPGSVDPDGLVSGAYLTVFPDGRLVQLSLPGMRVFRDEVPKRGKVAGFSDDARARLMELLHTLRRSHSRPAFITLTFPDEMIPTPAHAKALLFALFKRWKRRGRLCGVWRMEAHPERSERLGRPVPHFHLLVWGGWVDRHRLSEDWAEIVDAESGQETFAKHLSAGTKVESIRSFRGVCYYASKYISKAEECSLGEDCGRVWGVFNRTWLPVSKPLTFKLTIAQIQRCVAFVRQFFEARGWRPRDACHAPPRSIYCDDPGFICGLMGINLSRAEAA